MRRDQATAIILLWESRQFDSATIARLLHVEEAEVARLVQAGRDIRREMARDGVAAEPLGVGR